MKNHAPPFLHALTEGPNIALDKPIVLIGRHQECDIQIPSRKISRRHCCLAQVDDHLVVRDLGSTNGIRINGVRVLEGSLQSGDELMIGNIRYQLKWGETGELASPTAMKNGIMLVRPQSQKRPSSEDSCDVPVPIPEVSQSQPIPQGKPITAPPQNNAEMG